MSDITKEGGELITRWMHACNAHRLAKELVTKRSYEEINASNALGTWLMPDDAKPGEKFCVWYGDSLIEVTVTNDDLILRVRKRGRSLNP